MLIRWPALTLMIVLASASAVRAAIPKDLVVVDLHSSVSSIQAGKPFTVGVLLKIKPHWHVYWKNPGDSGLPTKVKWNLPEGFTVGPLVYPLPVNFDQPGNVAGYGYNEEVMLTAEITPPKDLSASSLVEFGADVSWLVCEKVCVPGKISLKKSLTVSAAEVPADAQLFKDWREQQSSAIKADAQAATNGDGTISVPFTLPAGAKDAQWFPIPPKESGVEDLQTKTDGGVSTTTLKLVPAPKESSEMQFLVAYNDSNGKRQGVEFSVKLPSPAK